MYLYKGKEYAEHQFRDLMSQIDADIRSETEPVTVGERYGRLHAAKVRLRKGPLSEPERRLYVPMWHPHQAAEHGGFRPSIRGREGRRQRSRAYNQQGN